MPSAKSTSLPFHPAVCEWFAASFPGGPTRSQQRGWASIQSGESTLILAPTGSGKTLAAFLAAIDRIIFAPPPPREERCQVVYVSPLRALAVDVERNLRLPIQGIASAAERSGERCHVPEVAIRTGDTPAEERERMLRRPPDLLITTPESLFLLLTSRGRSFLASARLVVVDEVHALVGTKRGAHLALTLERLQDAASCPIQRVGLSATMRPLDEAARFLGGGEGLRTWRPRAVAIVDAGARKAFDLRVEVPVEDMARPGEAPQASGAAPSGEPPTGATRRSIWPAIHPPLLDLVRSHRSTIVFVNSRRLAERIAAALNDLAGEAVARAHHGSVAREQRLEMEEALKAGRLPCIVATSSLELGIDMGAVDLVVQIEAPPSVSSGMQRIGRAGHHVEAVSRGVIFPKFRGDLLASAAISEAMMNGAVESVRMPRNPLDVLAQQVLAAVAVAERRVDDLFALARRAAPFATLSRPLFEGVLDMLSGRYPSDEFAELRPRVTWDRLKGTVRAREGLKRLVVTNAGTIPDRGLYGVFLAGGESTGRRVGELDEEMVFESRAGETFVLGATSWRIVEITRDRVLVAPAPGQPGKMPFWKADRGSRPAELGRAIGVLTRELSALPPAAARQRLTERHGLGALAADNLLAYLAEQEQATGVLPDDRTLVLERTRDLMGDWRLCLLSPWGGRTHAPWAMAIEARLRAAGRSDVETLWSDDGIVLRVPDCERPPEAADLVPEPEEVADLVVRALGESSLFAGRFREAAARALLLPRRRPGHRTPLWMQRKKAHDLLSVASRYPAFPIVLEAHRECLQEVFDLPGLVELAERVRRREIRLVTVDTRVPSPFSASLLFGYVASYIYDGDAPLAERRAQALSVDQRQLRELLGEAELRELLDRDSLQSLEQALQGRDAAHRARGVDRLHDLLLRLGDLTLDEIRARCDPSDSASAWTSTLISERRAIAVRIAGEERFAATEDAGKLRDALGVELPQGLPQAFLEPVPLALCAVVARYARTHGPFRAVEIAKRYALDIAPIAAALADLERDGRVIQGEFRPGGAEREWCAPDVLAALRRRSLAALRRQVEPAEPAALARLLLDWHGIAAPARRGGPDALLDVVEQLQGAVFPASTLEGDVLAARLPAYRAADLDALCAAGEVIWVGMGALGERDGRVALFLADDLGALLPPAQDRPDGEAHERICQHLAARGASFFLEICGGAMGDESRALLAALWDLVWAGEVTNDSLEALRAFLAARTSRAQRHRRLGRFRSRRQLPPTAVGRWSLVPRAGTAVSPTERWVALAQQLLARHGVLTRDAVAAEAVAGGFAAVYPVLKGLEDAGRVRRGYFVAGLGGAQFADPGALDRLRALRDATGDEPQAAVLAAADPANPYGAALPWPSLEGVRLARAAGAHVVLVDGVLAGHVSRDEREVLAFLPEAEPDRSRTGRAVARALAAWAARTGHLRLGFEVGGSPPLGSSPIAPFLLDAGFVRSGPGVLLVTAPDEPR
jgi:ATP-dependent helicase Lhr and Lhr-like helicase